jgi:hypothetical protein
VKSLVTPNPTWTGTTVASEGPTGTVTVTFGTAGTVSWTGATGTYTGTFSTQNPADGASVTATITGQGAASGCVYTLNGTVLNGVLDGTYHLQGSCIDHSRQGTFHLVQGASTTTPEVCVATLSSSSLNVDHSAHTHQTVTVTRTGDCSGDITVTGLPAWIHLESNSGGVVSLTIDENGSSVTRTATLMIAGQNVVVTQTAAVSTTPALCVVTLSASSLNVDHSAHTHQTVTVTRTSDCSGDITLTGLPDWIHVESNSGGVVSLMIDENGSNPSATRAATLAIAGQNYVVTQTGKEASACNYTLAGPQNAATMSFPSAGGSGSLNVDTSQGNCTWTMTADASWITGINPASDTGKGAVSYSVQTNTGAQRTGHISIKEAGTSAQVTVTQDAAPVVCTTFGVTPTSFSTVAFGGASLATTVTGTAPSGCTGGSYAVSSNASWLHVSPTGGITVDANSSTSSRADSVVIAGVTVTVNQVGVPVCTGFTVTPTDFKNLKNDATTLSVTVTGSSPASCTGGSYTASSNSSWLHVSNNSGSITVDANNTGSDRNGSVEIAGTTVTVAQKKN